MAPRPQTPPQLHSSSSRRRSASTSSCASPLDSLLSPLARSIMDPLPTLSELRHSPLSSIPQDGRCWRWTIPAIVEDGINGGDHNDGLSEVAVATLAQCLRPVLDGLAALDAEILLELERCPRGAVGAALQDGIRVKPIHDAIEPPTQDQRAVRYLHLSELEGQYSMGIFVFPPHARIPLHDHPGMCVLSRVLYGDVHRLQLDLARDNDSEDSDHGGGPEPQPARQTTTSASHDQENNAASHHRASRKRSIDHHYQTTLEPASAAPLKPDYSIDSYPQSTSTAATASPSPPPVPPASATPPVAGARRAFRRNVDHLRAPGTTMLFPYEGNLHEFVAGPNGAALLDVLLPPYDLMHHRDCTFYEILSPSDGETDAPVDLDDGTAGGDRTPCWIVPTGQPEDFHCISGRFRDIGSSSSSSAATTA